jgi:hypothetical protein
MVQEVIGTNCFFKKKKLLELIGTICWLQASVRVKENEIEF